MNLGSGKNSIIGSHTGGAYGTAKRAERETELWNDFHKHFSNKTRGRTPQNHHDFLDVIKQQRDSLDGVSLNAMPAYARLTAERALDRADELLANDRIERAHRNYN